MVRQHPKRPAADPLLRYESACLHSGVIPALRAMWAVSARGTRKVEGCAGRRSRPAQRAEAKRTPEQPGRGRRDGPVMIQMR